MLGTTAEGQAERTELMAVSGHPVIADAAASLAALDFDREYDYGMHLLLAAITDAAKQTR